MSFFLLIKSWKIVTDGISLFNNCNIKNFSEGVPLLNDVTVLISSLSFLLRFDLMMDESIIKPSTIDRIMINGSTIVKY